MNHSRDPESLRLQDNAAQELLARAAEFDSASSANTTVADLRHAALEAGISSAAFDAALKALSVTASGEAAAQASSRSIRKSVPAWVRICLFGVPDRRVAMTCYWLFVAIVCALPVLAITGVHGPSRTIGIALFLLFALWSTSQAVKWADYHGWNSLR